MYYQIVTSVVLWCFDFFPRAMNCLFCCVMQWLVFGYVGVGMKAWYS